MLRSDGLVSACRPADVEFAEARLRVGLIEEDTERRSQARALLDTYRDSRRRLRPLAEARVPSSSYGANDL